MGFTIEVLEDHGMGSTRTVTKWFVTPMSLTAPLCDSLGELARVNRRRSMRGSILNYLYA